MKEERRNRSLSKSATASSVRDGQNIDMRVVHEIIYSITKC
jgi:hypothetical protein